MSDLAGLLGNGESGCPICGADSCSGMPHIQPISIKEFYGEPMAQEPDETADEPEPETAEVKRRKRDENRMKRGEDR